MKNKTCINCNKNLDIRFYYKNTRQADGYDYYCKYCRVGSTLKSHRNTAKKSMCKLEGCEKPTYALKLCKMHYERNRRNGHTNLINYGRKSYNGQSYDRVRARHIMLRYKMTMEQYEQFAKDGCEICAKGHLAWRKLHIDHDHNCCPVEKNDKNQAIHYRTCGLCIRGPLCDKCNGAVGLFEAGMMRDDYPNRNKIVNYIAKYNHVISDRIVNYGREQRDR